MSMRFNQQLQGSLTHIPNSCGSMPSRSSLALRAGSIRPSSSHIESQTLIIGCLVSGVGEARDALGASGSG